MHMEWRVKPAKPMEDQGEKETMEEIATKAIKQTPKISRVAIKDNQAIKSPYLKSKGGKNKIKEREFLLQFQLFGLSSIKNSCFIHEDFVRYAKLISPMEAM